MTTKRDVQRRVTRSEAVGLFADLQRCTRGCGYAVGLYGSALLQPDGADVDVLAVPFPVHDEDVFLEALEALGTVRVLPYTLAHGFLPVEVVTPEGFSIDLHVHRIGNAT